MKKYLCLILTALAAFSACHKPEYVLPTADRQGLTSLTAIMVSGPYADQELGRLTVTDPDATLFEIPIPYYYPESSDDETLIYMTNLRVQAELQPNCKISPKLGLMDLTENNVFTFTDQRGNSREITITGKRVKPSACSLLAMMVEEVKTSAVIYEDKGSILIPYLDDLSAVTITAQVSPHAKVSKISGKAFVEGKTYNLNTGATVTVLAGDGKTEKTYSVSQGIPDLLPQGLRAESVGLLSNVDPVSIVHLPAFNEKAFVSLAGLGTQIIVGLGEGRTPVYVDAFTGTPLGTIALGEAVADCLTNDDAGHLLLANYAEGGDNAGEVKIYLTSSVTQAPTLFYTFTNPISFPIGHRIKVLGDVTGDAAIVFTSEGIAGVSVWSEIVVLTVEGGNVTSVKTKNFAPLGLAWGSAPVNFATVVPASVTPFADGWFVDYYEGNVDPAVTDSNADCYLLHYFDGRDKDTWVERMGNWSINPNCLDIKTFNGARYLALFAVSHFPEWDIRPRLHFFEVTDPSSATRLFANDSIKIFQKGTTDPEVGAAGDVALVPSADGYRMYLYYYDHHAQAIGAYVTDCFDIQ